MTEAPLPSPEPLDAAGIAAVYRERARAHEREAMKAFQSHRPIKAEAHRKAAQALFHLAGAEVEDPVPDGLEKQIPHPDTEAGSTGGQE